jgi:hypothetical protein
MGWSRVQGYLGSRWSQQRHSCALWSQPGLSWWDFPRRMGIYSDWGCALITVIQHWHHCPCPSQYQYIHTHTPALTNTVFFSGLQGHRRGGKGSWTLHTDASLKFLLFTVNTGSWPQYTACSKICLLPTSLPTCSPSHSWPRWSSPQFTSWVCIL